jgi:hypothetical protein
VRALLIASSLSFAVVASGCSGGTSTLPATPDAGARHTQANGAPGGGGGGGGTAIPPPMITDGPSQFIYSASSVIGTPLGADINFDRLQNMTPGPIAQGTTRAAAEIIFNNSKKTALTISSATIQGTNAGDFTVSAVPSAPLAPNKDTSFVFRVTFTPSGDGLRSATLAITSNAGTATANLSGSGLVNRPVVTKFAPLSFLPTSAPAILEMANGGGPILEISSVSITGPNADMFGIFPLQGAGLGTCQFVGIPPGSATVGIGANSFCHLEVGLQPGATAPASAFLTIVTNDPITPVENVPITLSPL